MNVLMITGDRALAAGKQGAFHATLAELHKHFDRIDVICPRSGVRRYDMQLFGNVWVHPSPLPLVLQWFWIVWKGRALAKTVGSVVMSVHESPLTFNGVGARALAALTGIPYMLEVHHIVGYPRASGLHERVGRWLTRLVVPFTSRRAAIVRVVNAHEAPEFLVAAGVPRARIQVIPSVYLDRGTFEPRDVPKQYDLVFVGRMARNKGIQLFLEVLARTGLVGVAVGDGPLLPWVRNEAKRRGLKLHTPGFVRDSAEVAEYLNRSRLLLMTSLNEGGPRVVLESLACGVPVLATPIGIVPDVLPPEAIEEWDVAALADKVQNILGDASLYARLRESGLQAVVPFERRAAITAYADALKTMIR